MSNTENTTQDTPDKSSSPDLAKFSMEKKKVKVLKNALKEERNERK
jgi:hypothetical protein